MAFEVRAAAFVQLNIALAKLDDEQAVQLEVQQRLWPKRGASAAPGARRCVFGRLANRQNAESPVRTARSLNDQRMVAATCLALGAHRGPRVLAVGQSAEQGAPRRSGLFFSNEANIP
jgi:hypothetical protein